MNTEHPFNEPFPSINQFKELLEKYNLLETMAELGKIGAWKVEIETNTTLWTKELFSIMEMDSPTPLTLEEILNFELPPYRSIHQKAIDDLMERRIPFDIEVESLTCKGNHRWLRIIGRGVCDADGKITHRIGITQDITDRKLLEQKAIQELKKYHTLFETIRDAILVLDQETGSILEVNQGAVTLYGYPKEELCSMQCTDLCTEPDTIHSALRKRTAFIPLQWQRKHDGSVFPGELTLAPLSLQNRSVCIVVVRDVLSRLEAEERIRSLLKEKELLLKEVHHRIKNHLQTLTSLLSLQSLSTDSIHVKKALAEAMHRIRSLGILYEKLYQQKEVHSLSLKEYLSALVEDLLSTFPKEVKIDVRLHVPSLPMEIKPLSVLGILVTEFLTNSLKYAFPGRSQGLISICMEEKPGQLLLVLEDDGVGIPPSVDVDHPSTFGLQLIHALVSQLEGSLRITSSRGTRIEIVIPKPLK